MIEIYSKRKNKILHIFLLYNIVVSIIPIIYAIEILLYAPRINSFLIEIIITNILAFAIHLILYTYFTVKFLEYKKICKYFPNVVREILSKKKKIKLSFSFYWIAVFLIVSFVSSFFVLFFSFKSLINPSRSMQIFYDVNQIIKSIGIILFNYPLYKVFKLRFEFFKIRNI